MQTLATYDKDLYFVAVKVFLRDADRLLIIHDIYGEWDLPGGRLKKDEFDTPLEKVIERKMREELGDDIVYSDLKRTDVLFRVERIEAGLNQKVRIFAVGYEAQYESGEIKLGRHVDGFEWVDVCNFEPAEYYKEWRVGVEDYLRQFTVVVD